MQIKRMMTAYALLAILALSVGGCATLSRESPPILAQDELIRPYTKLGRIQVTRETYGSDYSLTPDIREWGYTAIRGEAEKMGADAVILVEITGRTTTYTVIPSSEYRATGIAIKFK